LRTQTAMNEPPTVTALARSILALRVRDEWASLTEAERLVLASRLMLGLDPGVLVFRDVGE